MKAATKFTAATTFCVAVFTTGPSYATDAGEGRTTETVIVACNTLQIGKSDYTRGRTNRKPFVFEVSRGVPQSTIHHLEAAGTCAEAINAAKIGSPNPNCSTSAGPARFVATCDFQAETPFEN
jgi:hypothetical protein